MTEQKQQYQRSNASDNSMMIQHRSHNGTQQQQLTRAGSIDSAKSRSARNKPLTAEQKARVEKNRREADRRRMSRQSPSCNAPSAAYQHQSSSSAAMNPMSRQSPSCNALSVAQQHQSRQGMKLSANRSSLAGMNPLQTQNVQMKRTLPSNGDEF